MEDRRVTCPRCGKSVPKAQLRQGEPSVWVSTGQVWIDNPIPVFQHGAPTACHPAPIGMVPNGHWSATGYWTPEKTWAHGRPVDESGCDGCAKVVGEAGTAREETKRARKASATELKAVVRAAAADTEASLDGQIERYADAELERARSAEREAQLNALVTTQDRRASSDPGAPDAAPMQPTPPTVESDVRHRARARARRKAEQERQHQRLVNENARHYGDADEVIAEHGRLRRTCERILPAQHPFVLLACVVAGVAGAIEIERATDWVPPVLDSLRYSEDVRITGSVLLGAIAGVLLFGATSEVRRALNRRRMRSAARAAELLSDRIGCGLESCGRCPRTDPFSVTGTIGKSRVGGYLLVGAIAFAVYAGVAVGDRFVKLQRVAAAVPEQIRDDCRQRPIEGPVELVCKGPSVRAIGLRRAYFQFGNPSYDTYGEGIFEQSAAFRRCGSGRTYPGAAGKIARCGGRAAIWTDEKVVAGGAIGPSALRFARHQHARRG